MKRSKQLIVIGLLIILSILVFGCNKKDTQDKEPTNSNDETKMEEVELVMYSWRPEDRGIYEKAFEAFQKDYPHINIDFQPYKSTEYNTILTNALISGKGPDIIQLRPYSGARSIADNDYLLPLDDIDGLDNIQEQYLDAARGTDGKVYGVPLALNSGVIFYNTEIFAEHNIEVPTTWEEFIAVCEKLLENDVIPIAQSGRAAYLLSMTHAVVAPPIYNGNTYVEDIIEQTATLEDERFVDSVQALYELEKFFPKDFIAIEDESAQTLLYTEEAAMYINGEHRLGTFESTAPDLPIGVIPGLAASEGEDPTVTTWVDGSYAAVKNSEHQEEALLFMEFLASKEFGQIFTEEANRLSAIDGVVPEHPLVKEIADASSKSATPYLMLVHFGEGETTTKTIFENALQGLFLDELSVDEVIEEAIENVERVEKDN